MNRRVFTKAGIASTLFLGSVAQNALAKEFETDSGSIINDGTLGYEDTRTMMVRTYGPDDKGDNYAVAVVQFVPLMNIPGETVLSNEFIEEWDSKFSVLRAENYPLTESLESDSIRLEGDHRVFEWFSRYDIPTAFDEGQKFVYTYFFEDGFMGYVCSVVVVNEQVIGWMDDMQKGDTFSYSILDEGDLNYKFDNPNMYPQIWNPTEF